MIDQEDILNPIIWMNEIQRHGLIGLHMIEDNHTDGPIRQLQ